jgi:hypothetical protein
VEVRVLSPPGARRSATATTEPAARCWSWRSRSTTTPQLRAAAERAFRTWRNALAALLRRDGVGASEAKRLATLVVAAIEGAVALCRVERSLRPLDDVGREIGATIVSATA